MSYPTYKNLRSYQQAVIIYDITVEFCKQYLDPKSRTVDQMEQAARSGKQNIVEGSAASRHNPANEIFLIGVARASLQELLEDYEDFLRQRKFQLWQKDDPRALEMRALTYKTYTTHKSYMSDPERIANAMITLINQTNFLLDKQVEGVKRSNSNQGIVWQTKDQRAARALKQERDDDKKWAALAEELKNAKE